MNPYNYLFYRIYSFALRLKVSDSEITASIAVSVLFFYNVLFIMKLIKFKFINSKNDAIIFGLALIAINFLYFLRKKRFLKIKEKYEKESMLQKIIGSLIVIIYLIASSILPFAID